MSVTQLFSPQQLTGKQHPFNFCNLFDKKDNLPALIVLLLRLYVQTFTKRTHYYRVHQNVTMKKKFQTVIIHPDLVFIDL